MRLSRVNEIEPLLAFSSGRADWAVDPSSVLVECEIIPANPVEGPAFAAIAATCRLDLPQALEISVNAASRSQKESVVTPHLSAELAISPHSVWGLAFRSVRCVPKAQISASVQSENAFAEAAVAATHRRSA